IEQQPEAARRFMIAYLKSVRDYNDAFRKGKDKDAIIEIMAKRSTLNSKEIWAKVKAPGIDPNGYVDAKSVETAQEFHASRGWLKSKVDLAKVIDNQFVDHAIARLGRYQA
ncbi:MAG: metal ABC transporter substrate-binding protein, partial [Thermomicrobiales bacterium]|nr:metal ABC transporter substrate-binding protein [Thermomicrobiales bacterium]